MKIFVSFFYTMSVNGLITNHVDSMVTNAPIRCRDDIKALEEEVRKTYGPIVTSKGGKLVSVGVITWRPFDE